MFGLGPLEILVILAAFVIFVGPDKIPEVTKQVARFFVQAKRMSSDVKNVVDDAIRDAEREIEVKGKFGTLQIQIPDTIQIQQDESSIKVI